MTRPPQLGEPAPWFDVCSPVNPRFSFDTLAGRRVLLCFFGSAGDPLSRDILDEMLRHRDRFNGRDATFVGVSVDPADEATGRIAEELPGFHVFWDFDRSVSRLFGLAAEGAGSGSPLDGYHRATFLLDERLRILAIQPFEHGPQQRLLHYFSLLPPLEGERLAAVQAPILVVPHVFEPPLCQVLIDYYEQRGGQESGFMREVGGKTVLVYDYDHKRRRDEEIVDEALRNKCMFRIHDRLVPEIHKAFQFRASHIERYIVACYEAETGGHFRAHRDNTTRGTAHRRFAVSLNLNTGQYEGGYVRFPEFGRQLYTAPAGGAIVFSCSLLHEATRVTSGRRYAFLPFLYDEDAVQVREQTRHFVADREPGTTCPTPT
jgi:peroxiredoxin